ncbi:MAG TPA: hypothetical protein VI844_01320 [Coxiellaceae bacterium]|nr:hypothetical protein [Coxiellaceae bacterium]
MKKKSIAVAVGALLSMTTITSQANMLTLSNHSSGSINVTCNGVTSPIAMQPHSSLPPFTYWFVSALFGGGDSLNCTFKENGTPIGTATLNFDSSFQTADVPLISPIAGFTVVIDGANGQPVLPPTPEESNMTITLSQN